MYYKWITNWTWEAICWNFSIWNRKVWKSEIVNFKSKFSFPVSFFPSSWSSSSISIWLNFVQFDWVQHHHFIFSFWFFRTSDLFIIKSIASATNIGTNSLIEQFEDQKQKLYFETLQLYNLRYNTWNLQVHYDNWICIRNSKIRPFLDSGVLQLFWKIPILTLINLTVVLIPSPT